MRTLGRLWNGGKLQFPAGQPGNSMLYINGCSHLPLQMLCWHCVTTVRHRAVPASEMLRKHRGEPQLGDFCQSNLVYYKLVLCTQQHAQPSMNVRN